ncbi:unnamed protein product [Amoebophrya sp. A120]|nr:unnamed protein product [Amoebophrya sp. A120]|eukprot:GSA120T00013040001.1
MWLQSQVNLSKVPVLRQKRKSCSALLYGDEETAGGVPACATKPVFLFAPEGLDEAGEQAGERDPDANGHENAVEQDTEAAQDVDTGAKDERKKHASPWWHGHDNVPDGIYEHDHPHAHHGETHGIYVDSPRVLNAPPSRQTSTSSRTSSKRGSRKQRSSSSGEKVKVGNANGGNIKPVVIPRYEGSVVFQDGLYVNRRQSSSFGREGRRPHSQEFDDGYEQEMNPDTILVAAPAAEDKRKSFGRERHRTSQEFFEEDYEQEMNPDVTAAGVVVAGATSSPSLTIVPEEKVVPLAGAMVAAVAQEPEQDSITAAIETVLPRSDQAEVLHPDAVMMSSSPLEEVAEKVVSKRILEEVQTREEFTSLPAHRYVHITNAGETGASGIAEPGLLLSKTSTSLSHGEEGVENLKNPVVEEGEAGNVVDSGGDAVDGGDLDDRNIPSEQVPAAAGTTAAEAESKTSDAAAALRGQAPVVPFPEVEDFLTTSMTTTPFLPQEPERNPSHKTTSASSYQSSMSPPEVRRFLRQWHRPLPVVNKSSSFPSGNSQMRLARRARRIALAPEPQTVEGISAGIVASKTMKTADILPIPPAEEFIEATPFLAETVVEEFLARTNLMSSTRHDFTFNMSPIDKGDEFSRFSFEEQQLFSPLLSAKDEDFALSQTILPEELSLGGAAAASTDPAESSAIERKPAGASFSLRYRSSRFRDPNGSTNAGNNTTTTLVHDPTSASLEPLAEQTNQSTVTTCQAEKRIIDLKNEFLKKELTVKNKDDAFLGTGKLKDERANLRRLQNQAVAVLHGENPVQHSATSSSGTSSAVEQEDSLGKKPSPGFLQHSIDKLSDREVDETFEAFLKRHGTTGDRSSVSSKSSSQSVAASSQQAEGLYSENPSRPKYNSHYTSFGKIAKVARHVRGVILSQSSSTSESCEDHSSTKQQQQGKLPQEEVVAQRPAPAPLASSSSKAASEKCEKSEQVQDVPQQEENEKGQEVFSPVKFTTSTIKNHRSFHLANEKIGPDIFDRLQKLRKQSKSMEEQAEKLLSASASLVTSRAVSPDSENLDSFYQHSTSLMRNGLVNIGSVREEVVKPAQKRRLTALCQDEEEETNSSLSRSESKRKLLELQAEKRVLDAAHQERLDACRDLTAAMEKLVAARSSVTKKLTGMAATTSTTVEIAPSLGAFKNAEKSDFINATGELSFVTANEKSRVEQDALLPKNKQAEQPALAAVKKELAKGEAAFQALRSQRVEMTSGTSSSSFQEKMSRSSGTVGAAAVEGDIRPIGASSSAPSSKPISLRTSTSVVESEVQQHSTRYRSLAVGLSSSVNIEAPGMDGKIEQKKKPEGETLARSNEEHEFVSDPSSSSRSSRSTKSLARGSGTSVFIPALPLENLAKKFDADRPQSSSLRRSGSSNSSPSKSRISFADETPEVPEEYLPFRGPQQVFWQRLARAGSSPGQLYRSLM